TYEVGPGTRLRVATINGEEPVQPAHALTGRARDPVPAQGRGEIDSAQGVSASQASLKDRADVVDLQVRPREPLEKPVAAFQRGQRAPRPVILGAPQLDGFLLAGLSQLETGELAHRLVQAIAGDALGILLCHEGLV